ncbi:hypothetical protein PsalMR5_00781 [Piscirickettsia salmonis]|uniref:hypothetical protein n=1 Tax=Piscirickettsia salmonis TaxID=1238 RepID=UPI0012BB0799|nr:hypothetical protein [Piscirickettsia salmonis]QGP53373.1 hypothetical protein PsalSR1_00783 [Piscirickettsia salmonis]QGP60706.1 hypothetical protein PsalBI1_03325 [Piscirickettsia salmonis]QGP62938.1 hypothetical protein PsalMR5_00781 [Piscirickettsia salmonis]
MSDNAAILETRDSNGRFVKGHRSPNQGRPKGRRNNKTLAKWGMLNEKKIEIDLDKAENPEEAHGMMLRTADEIVRRVAKQELSIETGERLLRLIEQRNRIHTKLGSTLPEKIKISCYAARAN